MEKLFIKASKSNPEINIDPETNIIKVKGDSYPENTFKFYQPLFQVLDGYEKKGAELLFELELNYFNSSTSKVLYDLFDLLDKKRTEGSSVKVAWKFHEDNDFILEEGTEFSKDYPDLITLKKV